MASHTSAWSAPPGWPVLMALAVLLTACTSEDVIDGADVPRDAGRTGHAGHAGDAGRAADAGNDTVPRPDGPAAVEWTDLLGSGEVDAEPSDAAADVIFDPTALHTYEIEIPEQSLAWLDADPRAELYTEALLRFEGEEVGRVGVRYKGSVGAFRGCVDTATARKTCTKLSIKVKINWSDPDAKFHGLRKLQFHSMNRDPSMMRERLGYWVFRRAGIAAPRAVHARLLINGQLQGIYALVEQIDGRFTRSRFAEGGEGNLYKEAWPLSSDGSPIDAEALTPQLRTNEDEDPSFAQMIEFSQALSTTRAPEELPQTLARYMDPDYLMRYVAVDRAIAHDDGPFHWYCRDAASCWTHNFFIYEESASPRFWLVAWDLDGAFNIDNLTTTLWFDWDDTTLGCAPLSNPPFNLPLRAPYCDAAQHGMVLMQEAYIDTSRRLLAGPLRRDVLEERLLEWEQQIYPAVLEAAGTHDDAVDFGTWQQARARLRASIDRLLERTRARVERGPTAQAELLAGAPE